MCTRSNVGRLERGWKNLEGGRYRLAMFDADQIIQSSCDDGHAWELKGLIHFERLEFEGVCDAIERASLLVPLQDRAVIALAVSYGRLSRVLLAEDLLLEFVRSHPSATPEHLTRVANALDNLSRYALAANVCRTIIARHPEYAPGYYDLALFGIKSDIPIPIVESLIRHAIFLEPTSAHYRVGLCNFFLRQNRIPEAIHEVRLLCNANLDTADVLLVLRNMQQVFKTIGCECVVQLISNLIHQSGMGHVSMKSEAQS